MKAFFRVVTPEEARRHLAAVPPLGPQRVAVQEAAGRVLRRDLRAAVDLPHFPRAHMDGYAVHARDTFGVSASLPAYLRLAGHVPMGREARRRLRAGEAMRVSTGAMMPPGADAVVMVEYTDEPGDGTVEIHRPVSPGENVVQVGEDIRRGTAVLGRGRRLRAQDIGALSGLGITHVVVGRRPRVGLIATGDEIIPPDRRPRPGQVRNINQYALVSMVAGAGGVPRDRGVVRDEAKALDRALRRSLRHDDCVLVSGGSSVGTKDVTIEVLGALPGCEISFHGISMAPGKPTIFASALGKPVLALPGQPVSALVVFHLFGSGLIRRLAGEAEGSAFRPTSVTRAVLTENVASQPGREDYVRVAVADEDGRRSARPLPGKSAAISTLVRADGLVRIPLNQEGIEAGEEVEVILL